MHPSTRRNLRRTLEREAVAVARLTAYADRAERDGHREASHLFRAIAAMDLTHAAEIVEALDWVGTPRENILASVIGDATSHSVGYATLAYDAQMAGDLAAAGLFRRLVADETEAAIGLLALSSRDTAPLSVARARLDDELKELRTRMPSVPSVGGARAARARAA